MASNIEIVSTLSSAAPIVERVIAIRDRWHTKQHPFFRVFGEGKLPLKRDGPLSGAPLPLSCRRHCRASACSIAAPINSRTCAR